jgi:hypothetical protein
MYGGGTQSVAIAALIVQGKIPAPDWACIADTAREKSTTWSYLEKYVQPALPFKIHVVPKTEFATVDLWRNEDLLIPAYTNITGSISKLPTFCSNEWKTRPCHRWLRKQGVPPRYEKWIGFSADEPRRYLAMKKSQPETKFPLIDFSMQKRSGCAAIVRDMGWPAAHGSHCWMCPHMSDDEWQELTSGAFEMACVIDDSIRERDPHLFLHKSCTPLREVKFSADPFMRACDSGMCFV